MESDTYLCKWCTVSRLTTNYFAAEVEEFQRRQGRTSCSTVRATLLLPCCRTQLQAQCLPTLKLRISRVSVAINLGK